MPIPSGSASALDELYAVYCWSKTKSNVLILGIEINFFGNLPVWQMLSNVYLPEKKRSLSFGVNLEKSTEFAKCA